ncbi:MAG: class IV adenylate cyclase [Planctomycetaceae bacterium]|jgi:adenylate cyclase, class 2|nr:class IV adenylate cyclase [Planctomycetaceae bacterium]MBT6153888.1 class IV adenylate cyclase [Planctomycetaceae bacterium]MBT6486641.1 class IV adenylate cyclase [Planctomycetaceae bacterium]MBT6494289.1 class IV adenylate cyclase [Planctomycetaceae bacterium]
MFEVELKFVIVDAASILSQLEKLGAKPAAERHQQDRYFAHPVRDFAKTDEAFRIRSDGQQNCITYKGPVLDPHVKLRHEIETPVADGREACEQLAEMFGLLGFKEVRTVTKRRTPYHLTWNDLAIELTLDEVDGLGSFVEIETLADESSLDIARDAILQLADHLGLQDHQRKSYLGMLLERDG